MKLDHYLLFWKVSKLRTDANDAYVVLANTEISMHKFNLCGYWQ